MRPDTQAIERDRELYNPQIAWLLCACESELGSRSSLAGTVSTIERGGPGPGLPNTDPYSNYVVGWCVGDSPGDKWRKAWPIWVRLSPATQAVLTAHYTLRNDIPADMRTAVDGALGKLGPAALWVHEGEALAKLMNACHDHGKEGRSRILAAASKRTEEAIRVAHREWDAVGSLRPEGVPDARDEHFKPRPDHAVGFDEEFGRRKELKARAREINRERLGAAGSAFAEHLRLAALGSFRCSRLELSKALMAVSESPVVIPVTEINPMKLARRCRVEPKKPEATAAE